MDILSRVITLALALTVSPASATDLFVPGDAPTIAAALDLAVDGDRILVAPGIYGEPLVVDVDVEIIGVEGARHTIVDGTGHDEALLTFGSTTAASVSGLTFRGGATSGVIPRAQCVVERCVITDNDGPGVGSPDFSTAGTIRECEITENRDGGVRTSATLFLHIERCLIARNTTPTSGGGATGAALVDCVIVDNSAQQRSGGVANSDVTRCLIARNEAPMRGAASYGNVFTTIEDSVFLDNTSTAGGPDVRVSQGVSTFGAYIAWMLGSTFVDQVVEVSGGAAVLASPEIRIDRCTFQGGALEIDPVDAQVTLTNTIIRGSTYASPVTPRWCDVEGWTGGGVGNIDADPLFVGAEHGVVCLLPGSPCIDAGDPDEFDPDGTRADIGARPFTRVCGVGRGVRLGSAGLPSLAIDGSLAPASEVTLALSDARPDAPSIWIVGAGPTFAPLGSTWVVPQLTTVFGATVGADGEVAVDGRWPAGLPVDTVVWFQTWIADDGVDGGWAATDGLAVIAP